MCVVCVCVCLCVYFSKRKQITRPNWRYRQKLPRPIIQEAPIFKSIALSFQFHFRAHSTTFIHFLSSISFTIKENA